MGNQSNKVQLKVVHRKIILHHAFKMMLQIDEVQQFPHGLDGLKLWQAGIMLSRFCILESNIFKDKDVLQLGSGVGIAGMACQHWTQCKSITMSDYHPKVIEAIKRNLVKNKCKSVKAQIIDWRQHQKLQKQQYDIIMGSDIVYFGCPVKQLYQIFKKLLRVGGLGIIIIPDRKNYSELFLKEIEADVFDVKKEKLDKQEYKDSPLQNQQQGKKDYSLLYSIDFYVYKLLKNQPKND